MEDIKEKLLKDLPEIAIKAHPTKPYLSSIKAIYVTERFNDVFGVGKWQTKVQREHLDTESGMVVVKVTFEVPEHGIYYESYGGNDNGGTGNKNFDLGDAYKGATTDAITKIGSFLGVGIKVFKGLNDATKTVSKDHANGDEVPEDKKTWINIGDKAWERALSKDMPLKELRKYYKVSRVNGDEYLRQLTDKIQ